MSLPYSVENVGGQALRLQLLDATPFVRLTCLTGKPAIINVTEIERVMPSNDEGSEIVMRNGHYTAFVQEGPEEIFKRISSAQRRK